MQQSEKSSLSRRTVVTGLAATGVLAAYVATRGAGEPEVAVQATGQGRALAVGEIDQWSRMVGTRFQASGYRLALAGVRPLASSGRRPANVARQKAFLAVFDVLDGQDMPGNMIHSMSAAGRGALDVFLTSAASTEFPRRMHAVFN